MSKIMSKSILILALLCLMVSVVGINALTAIASAGCATCGAEENWDPQAELNNIGNTAAEQTGPQVYSAAVARQTNSQFNVNAAKNGNTSASNSEMTDSPVQAPELNVNLNNIGASPNPANPGSPVKITATLGDVANMTAYAIISNSVGVEVSNLTLDQTPGGEYVGTWTAAIAGGIYNTTLVASAQGESKTFNDALQIAVNESGNGTGTSASASAGNGKTSNYMKLG